MATVSNPELLTLIERHLDVTNTAPSAFGMGALGDAGFVFRLRKGARPRDATVHRVLDYMIDDAEELLAARNSRAAWDAVLPDLRAELQTIVEEAASVSVDLINQTMLIPIPDDLFARLHVVEGRA